MKRIILSISFLLIVFSSFSQIPAGPQFSKDYYLQKSKHQKTTAWVLLGSGAAIAATGGIIVLKNHQANGYPGRGGIYAAIGGGIVCISSIPFFISSSNNKKKAASIAISNQNIFAPCAKAF